MTTGKEKGGLTESLGGMDVLESAPALSGDTRFLQDYFLPEHGRLKRAGYLQALQELGPPDSGGNLAVRTALRGRVRRILGDAAGAAVDFEAALRADPDCASALAFRGEMRLVREPGAALADLGAAIERDPRAGAYHLWLGYARFLLMDWAGAVGALDRAQALAPRSAATALLRGIVHERMGSLAQAEEDLTRVVRSGPDCPGLYTLRATVRWKRGDREGAVEDAHRAVTLHPENLDAFSRILYLSQGAAPPASRQKQRAVLIQACNAILEKDPRCAWAFAFRGEMEGRRESDRVRPSVEDLERAVQLDPDRAWMQSFLGRALTVLAEKREDVLRRALFHADAAVRLAPDAGWILAWRAEVFKMLGMEKEAMRDLDACLAGVATYPLAFAWRAAARRDRGHARGAVADFKACQAILPRASFYQETAQLLFQLGEVEESIADLTRCVQTSTEHAWAYGGWGWLQLLPRPEKGAPSFRRGLFRLRPLLRGASARVGKGGRTLRLGPPASGEMRALEALSGVRFRTGVATRWLDGETLARFIDKTPGFPPALAWLGRVHLNAGRIDSALRCLDAALAEDPKSALALAWRGEARCRAGEFAAALCDLDASLAQDPAFGPAILWRAITRIAGGDGRAGLEDMLAACRREPDRAPLIYGLARWTFPGLQPLRGGRVSPLLLAEFLMSGKDFRGAGRLLDGLPAARLGAMGLAMRAFARGRLGDHAGRLDDIKKVYGLDASLFAGADPSLLESMRP